MMDNYFAELYRVNVNDKVEKKNGLSYVSWPFAWAEVKKRHPDATYTIYERQTDFGPVNYFTDGRTCWVKTGVLVEGIEHIEMLPVMDFKNRSIPADAVTSMDVNKAIQRSLTKAVARHGLGLYIYAGEDLPEDAQPEPLPDDAAKPGDKVTGGWNPKTAISAWCGRYNVKPADFAALRKALISSGIVPDIASAEMRPEDFDSLVNAILANFPEIGSKTA